ncbi:AAA-type ATPase lid domain-containing protein [Novipirellula artificiosorum]|uniref:Transcriptional regulatory protein ZraR n=1 Tax=Novipirellula artificiosorum TaxID=2528016 RepID=A0A5C6E539_9BACT|nr:helix-turn-helix domain-containing protein [Novipirellula artificiosorum]TWU42701.1 Transcriptional regulatory protein ZraR [Novipirellula artificiosorum]
MTAGTKIRNLMRLLDASDAPVWAIGPDGKLVYLSAATARWLGLEGEALLNRRAVAGSPVSDDPLDQLAATLSAPPGLRSRGTASLRVQPHRPLAAGQTHRPLAAGQAKPSSFPPQRIEPLDVRFVRIGSQESSFVFAIAGQFDDRTIHEEIANAAIVRAQLDAWRKEHASIATLATAGTSLAARRIRSRLHVAASLRTHLGFFGPPGSAAESIARQIHHTACPREPLVMVDGPLMDPELLDASIIPAVNRLTESPDALATAIVRDLDEMPVEAQRHLANLVERFTHRFRIIGLCSSDGVVLQDSAMGEYDLAPTLTTELPEPRRMIIADLIEKIGGLTISLVPLASRVEDIPLIATGIVDSRYAAGEGRAERVSRAAIDSLVSYPWPNNFAELDAALRHAIRSAPGDHIGAEHLPLAIRSYHPAAKPKTKPCIDLALDHLLEAYEIKLIERALESTGGNRAAAARVLGITRSRLIRRLDVAAKGGTSDDE